MCFNPCTETQGERGHTGLPLAAELSVAMATQMNASIFCSQIDAFVFALPVRWTVLPGDFVIYIQVSMI